MTDETELPPVTDDELLARFVLFRKWIRNDQTVRQDAFIPYPYPNLSVTRHIGLSESELWQLGQSVADKRALPLYGRADVPVRAIKSRFLDIEPTPEPRNHANITGWPIDKPRQKMIAQQIAAAAEFVPKA